MSEPSFVADPPAGRPAAPRGASNRRPAARGEPDSQPLHIDDLELGILLGVLVGEGSFGGDGRQPSITVRMHVRHAALFEFLSRVVPGSRLYGPYRHGGREYYQWIVRGPALRRLTPVLAPHLTPALDAHAAERFERMRATYRL